MTLPVIAYRVLFRAFGLRYLPFQMLAVLLHLGVIVLLWCTARRLRVRPAIATLTLLPFAFYGAGRSNILFGFQIALTGSIVFGLAHLLLATDDEPSPRRDLAGILLGLGAIMCSAVGIPMVVGTAVAVLIRRGWRAAALHAVPLGVVYAVWYVAYRAGKHISTTWAPTRSRSRGTWARPRSSASDRTVWSVSHSRPSRWSGVVRAVQVARSDRHSGVPAIVAALLHERAGVRVVDRLRSGRVRRRVGRDGPLHLRRGGARPARDRPRCRAARAVLDRAGDPPPRAPGDRAAGQHRSAAVRQPVHQRIAGARDRRRVLAAPAPAPPGHPDLLAPGDARGRTHRRVPRGRPSPTVDSPGPATCRRRSGPTRRPASSCTRRAQDGDATARPEPRRGRSPPHAGHASSSPA